MEAPDKYEGLDRYMQTQEASQLNSRRIDPIISTDMVESDVFHPKK